MRKEWVLAVADLRYVTITCPHCRTQVTLDMKEKSAFAKAQRIFAPKKCPACFAAYDSATTPGIDGLQLAYEELTKISDGISFRGESADVPSGEGK